MSNTNNHGKRLMAQVIDDLAVSDPAKKVCTVPKGSSVGDGFASFTFKELAHAVNYTAWWIEKSLGRSSSDETLTYIGANDLRYLVIVIACNKTGYKASTPHRSDAKQHTNSSHAGVALLDEEFK